MYWDPTLDVLISADIACQILNVSNMLLYWYFFP